MMGTLALVVALACPVAAPADAMVVFDSFGWPRPGGRAHGGIDIEADEGTPLVAVVAGVVAEADWDGGGGNSVTFLGDDGVTYFYAHLVAPSFRKVGERLARGTVLGHVGSTGLSATNHLHFSVYPKGRPGRTINPYPLVAEACTRALPLRPRGGVE